MAPKVCKKTSEDHFLEATPQKWSAKVARHLFGQVWESLGKHPLHPQKFSCSYTYEAPCTNVKPPIEDSNDGSGRNHHATLAM